MMKANKFVKKYGWDHAKDSISNVPIEYIELSADLKCVAVNGRFKYCMTAEISKKKSEVYINELKHLVESYELVQKFGGLVEAKGEYFEIIHSGSHEGVCPSVLSKAIADVESCQ